MAKVKKLKPAEAYEKIESLESQISDARKAVVRADEELSRLSTEYSRFSATASQQLGDLDNRQLVMDARFSEIISQQELIRKELDEIKSAILAAPVGAGAPQAQNDSFDEQEEPEAETVSEEITAEQAQEEGEATESTSAPEEIPEETQIAEDETEANITDELPEDNFDDILPQEEADYELDSAQITEPEPEAEPENTFEPAAPDEEEIREIESEDLEAIRAVDDAPVYDEESARERIEKLLAGFDSGVKSAMEKGVEYDPRAAAASFVDNLLNQSDVQNTAETENIPVEAEVTDEEPLPVSEAESEPALDEIQDEQAPDEHIDVPDEQGEPGPESVPDDSLNDITAEPDSDIAEETVQEDAQPEPQDFNSENHEAVAADSQQPEPVETQPEQEKKQSGEAFKVDPKSQLAGVLKAYKSKQQSQKPEENDSPVAEEKKDDIISLLSRYANVNPGDKEKS